MNRLWCVLFVFLIVGQGLAADCKDPNEPNNPNKLCWKKWDVPVKNPDDANEIVQAKWDAVIRVLQNKELEQKTKEKIIDKIVSPLFDFALMGKLSLGRTNWPKLTDSQKQKFTKLFTQRLKDSYREKITLYKDEKATLMPAIPQKTTVHIPMELISNDKRIDIVYKLRKKQKAWNIYDVEIQGVSILLTYRSQFDDILKKGSVDDLLLRLEGQPKP